MLGRCRRISQATGDSLAGRRAADVYPSLEGAYPDLVYETAEPDSLFLAFFFLAMPVVSLRKPSRGEGVAPTTREKGRG